MCKSGVAKGSATQIGESFSKSGKMLQISKAVHRRGDGSSHHHLPQTKTKKKQKPCTASEIWPVEDVDEVTRDETKLQKQHEFG